MALKEFIGENRLAQVLTLLKNHIMTGATSSTAGASGFVPAPSAGDQDKVLKGDGTWSAVVASGCQPLYSTESTSWDTAPTANSTKPVTSGGIYSYIDTNIVQAFSQSY